MAKERPRPDRSPGLYSRSVNTKCAFADCTSAQPAKAGFVTQTGISIPEKSSGLETESPEAQAGRRTQLARAGPVDPQPLDFQILAGRVPQ
jgi:hypothetical protein